MLNQFSLNKTIAKKVGYTHYFSGMAGSSFALSLAKIAEENEGLFVVLLPDASSVLPLRKELEFFLSGKFPVKTLPDWETLPYDYFSPHQDIISERLETLYQIPRLKKGILLLPVASALQKLPQRSFIEQHCLRIRAGDSLDIENFKNQLVENGYVHLKTVISHGEFAIRGSIIDLFPMGVIDPIRIELFDDEIESLRYFDSESQLTKEKIKEVNLLPANEYPTDETAISKFRQRWRNQFDVDIKNCSVYRDVSNGIFPAGIEYYLPLFYDELSTLFDFLPKENTILVEAENILDAAKSYWAEIDERYEQRRYDVERPIVLPDSIYIQAEELLRERKAYPQVSFLPKKASTAIELSFTACPKVNIEHKSNDPTQLLKNAVPKFQVVLICAESAGRQEVIRELLTKHHIICESVDSWQNFLSIDFSNNASAQRESVYLTIAPVQHGFSFDGKLVISEADLFGRQILQNRRSKDKVESPDQLIHSLAELKIGDPVVHVDQGVGRYLGLQTIDAGGMATEFLTLEYSGGDKLYVPVQSLHQIHRYSGSNPELAPWHKLGTESWSKAKKKAIEKARDTAAELLDIYARRGAEIGFKHQIELSDYEKFANEFPFELTDDQATAIDALLNDMRSKKPMDRLVCGDVGFGKTEVAMRAAFVSVQNGMQVAMLVPTTLLAQQHFNSFQDRFSEWPINIAVLSRFQTKKEQSEILENLENGKIDLVIGTHRLISGNLKFRNLGLLLIDEEHRFGVRQKEILKSYRAKVDILTLTATPIPRTLNMSMSGMRDLSIIATPPAKRLAIKTFVRPRNEPLIKEAIQREIRRGGQVYFLHNAVDTIENTANELRELIPDIQVAVAHGQMRERQLEDVMSQFYHQRFHVLVCTTIIETGIDVPTANTIIMDRADKLGLAQLHQLRGRVGRSHHQAYAYLLTPQNKKVTKDAEKRLQAIEKLEDLGAGFILATHDLEIRGAGELLGDEQSGHMQTIGFSLYMELLERSIEALKNGTEPSLIDAQEQHTEVNLNVSALLPEDYVPDVGVRLSLYKRIASAKDKQALRQIQVELIDRFGLLPDSAKNLFVVTTLKQSLTKYGITKLDANLSRFTLEFTPKPAINTDQLISLIQTNPSRYSLIKGTKLQISQVASNIDERMHQIDALIGKLTR